MADENIVIKIEFQAEDGSVKTAFAKVEKEAESAGKKIGDSLGKNATGSASALSTSLGGIGKAFVGLAAGAFAFSSIKSAINGAMNEAREGQDAINRLSAALANNGAFSKQAVDGFTQYADSLSRITGIDDDLIIKNGALLSSLTGLTGQGLERATKAALDLAQATGKDLGTATQLISRAANGGADALKRYGIVIDENTPKSEKFQAALAQIEKRFGGMAQTNLNTFSGSVDNLSNAFGDLQKVFGNIIVESPAVRAVLQVTANLIRDLADNLKTAFQGDIMGNFISSLLKVGMIVSTNILPPFEILFNILKTGFLGIVTGVTGLANAIINLKLLIFEYIVTPLVDGVLGSLSKIVGIFSKDMEASINSVYQQIKTGAGSIGTAAGELAGGAYSAASSALVDSANTTFEASASEGAQNLIQKYQDAIATITTLNDGFKNSVATATEAEETGGGVTEGFTNVLAGLNQQAEDTKNNFQKNFKQIGANMFQTLGTGAGQAFAAFGAAVKKGEKPLDAFANAMLAAFGQAFVQLGTGYILQGAAAIWAGDPRGPGLMAAGAALAAFGGILSAMGGGSPSAAGATGGGTGEGGATSPNADIEDLNQLELQQPRNQITLNVNGDVLDSNETGVRLTTILREFADKNGNTEVFT